MNLRQLEYILMIEKEGSISKAAEKLYISQPALSQQLSKLEEELGTPIFERGTTPLRLTYVGLEYMNTIKKFIHDYKQLLTWIDDTNELKRGKVIIGIPPNRTIQVLPLVLPSFQEKYPNIEVVLKEAKGLSLPELVEKGEIDFALMSAKSDSNQLTFIPVVKEEVLLAVPPKSPFNEICKKHHSEKGYVDIALCKDESFILMKAGYRLHNIALELFARSKISPKIVLKTENVELAHKMTSAGLGLSFVGQIATELDSLAVKPNYYSIRAEKYSWLLGITYAPNKYITKAMQAFIDHFLQEMKQYGFYYLE